MYFTGVKVLSNDLKGTGDMVIFVLLCKTMIDNSQTMIDKLLKMLLNAPVPAVDSKPTTALINQP